MATINDVAAKAGVSTATVSRTLNGKSTVDPVLAARVQAAAAELGYHPNGLARNLRRQETAVLALIISDVENPFFTAIARGVEDIAQTAGYSVVLCNADDNEEKERRYIDVALQERVAGVVLSPTGRATNVDRLTERGTPVVAVDRPLLKYTGDQVLVDTRLAARDATRHLIDGGYRRVACVSGPAGVRTAEDRLAGYTDAVGEENALTRRAEFRAEGGRLAALSLLDESEPPDALLVGNSTMAIGVLEALAARGLRSGQDVGIVSFDDAPWTTLIDPPLTVVAQPANEVGRVAAELLLARIGDSTRKATTTTLQAKLIVRRSSRRD
ncbi:LacI family transcriptional regulator [Amycolatopsis sp. WAC 01375]|uniref:LacI family DNA-binding transcriptional regulator n=1 Tax=unclassified Amycolatopsis TaxID=2618356 RepID=UPI000F78E808|nr:MULTISPECIES: LacI family DNA-binding transcriptional regulator [unclassified Amycolatopsis]RSM80809.1 LacI family transcriptional regulator [Amycolatopsis sp. WAC 01375]RSN29655.1 LacI family transcriptional regulator [Amycolatopsis sp. WAC 01416]